MSKKENRRVYGKRWGSSKRVIQMRGHIWRELEEELRDRKVLEIGPGLRPTAPVKGSYFIDIAPEALEVLRENGGITEYFSGGELPFPDNLFSAVFAFEVLEHIEKDEELLQEIRRVLGPGGLFVFSTPIGMSNWSRIDDTSAHVRRYEADELWQKLENSGFSVTRYEPKFTRGGTRMNNLGVSVLERFPRTTNFFLQEIAFPLHAVYQKSFARSRWINSEQRIKSEKLNHIKIVAHGLRQT